MKGKIVALFAALSLFAAYPAAFAAGGAAAEPELAIAASNGTCGDGLTWTLDGSGTLTISGSGAMYSYDYSPWYDSRYAIKTVIISDSVTSIGESVFDDCSSLTSVTIGNSVEYIENRAFRGCSSLTSVNIPDSVTMIGNYAFSGCSSLTFINVSKGNSKYCSINGVLFNKAVTVLICCPEGKTECIIPDSVTTISNSAFYDCSALTSINIPDSVTKIRFDAFSGCSSLKTVNIGDSVTTIDNWAFSGCSLLSSINIPDCVTTIGYSAFFRLLLAENHKIRWQSTKLEQDQHRIRQ